jgi:hypothetical protein
MAPGDASTVLRDPRIETPRPITQCPWPLAAFGAGNYQAAFDHWIRHGKAEGRNPIP